LIFSGQKPWPKAIPIYPLSMGTSKSPWDSLFRIAVGQEGFFSAAQANEAGCSQQLLGRYLATGKIERVRRALYRIVHFPRGENEDLIALWLWSKNEGVFSHETALFLHQLSDALPTRAHLTLPKAWARREVKLPPRVIVSYDNLPDEDRTWHGPVPITTVRRTLADCLHANVSAELVAQASAQAAERGLITAAEVLTAPTIGLWRYRAHT
jgi:predicted transcriptional regulator of viral defense system